MIKNYGGYCLNKMLKIQTAVNKTHKNQRGTTKNPTKKMENNKVPGI